MFWTVVIIIVVFLFLSSRKAPAGQPSQRQRRKSAGEADVLLSQAELKLQSNQETEAMILFERAYWKADEAKQGLAASEAMYGLARIQMNRGHFGPAVSYLERAVELEKGWGESKPEFLRLLKSELANARQQSQELEQH